MIQAYSRNITVEADTAIPFNNVTLKKGCSAVQSGPATFQLNKAGIYMVSCNASLTPTAAGEVSIQLSKNGILQPEAISIEQGTADAPTSMSFCTLVQVQENNTCSCCTSPTNIQIINSAAGVFPIANIVITKLC